MKNRFLDTNDAGETQLWVWGWTAYKGFLLKRVPEGWYLTEL